MKRHLDVLSSIKRLLRKLQKQSHNTIGVLAALTATLLLILLISSDGHQLVVPTQNNQNDTDFAATNSDLSGPFLVERVIDGDTIVISKAGRSETIRLIGINTPEISGPYTNEECYGPEASQYVAKLLNNQYVYTMPDDTQDNRDKYDRLLRYVFIDENTHLNHQLVYEGYAFEYTYRTPYRYQQSFLEAQTAATDAARGLWSPETCEGLVKPNTQQLDELTVTLPDGCHHITQANEFVGTQACLVGEVDHIFTSRQNNQFINFCPSHEGCPFSAVIFSDDAKTADISTITPEDILAISGVVSQYRGQPQIIIRQQEQIKTLLD